MCYITGMEFSRTPGTYPLLKQEGYYTVEVGKDGAQSVSMMTVGSGVPYTHPNTFFREPEMKLSLGSYSIIRHVVEGKELNEELRVRHSVPFLGRMGDSSQFIEDMRHIRDTT